MANELGAVRCCGVTKRGTRCSITSTSALLEGRGRAVAEPLRRGGDMCLHHARPFCCTPSVLREAVVIFVDFESTGLDIARDRIVEIGAAATNGNFATVVSPGVPSMSTVHGIEEEELAHGPTFPVAWSRFIEFAEGVANTAVQDSSSDTDDDNLSLPRPPEETPTVLLVAHNGERFDFALLLCECTRHGISWSSLEQWRFVDSLSVLRALEPVGSCFKLQCMVRAASPAAGLQAHRALDDCLCLRNVLAYAAERIGFSLLDLLRPFAVRLDAAKSAALVSVIM